MWIRTAAFAFLIAAPLAGRADEPILLSPHSGIESSTNTITEPLVEGGLLMARSCLACNSLPLRMDARTELVIGKRAVTVGEFNKFVKAGGEHSLLIVYDKKTNTVVSLTVTPSTTRS